MIRETHRFTSAVWDSAEYLLRESPDAARRFILAAENTLTQIHEARFIGRRWLSTHPRLSEIRFLRIQGFPDYLIFYRIIEDGIEAVHLMHGARDVDSVLAEDV